jgi:hypothetical protein
MHIRHEGRAPSILHLSNAWMYVFSILLWQLQPWLRNLWHNWTEPYALEFSVTWRWDERISSPVRNLTIVFRLLCSSPYLLYEVTVLTGPDIGTARQHQPWLVVFLMHLFFCQCRRPHLIIQIFLLHTWLVVSQKVLSCHDCVVCFQPYSSTLTMETAYSFKMLINLYWAVQCHIPDDGAVCSQHHENITSNILLHVRPLLGSVLVNKFLWRPTLGKQAIARLLYSRWSCVFCCPCRATVGTGFSVTSC